MHNQSTAASSATSPARFVLAVHQCATASQMAVRSLAAKALAPLTPPEDLVPMLSQLLTQAQAAAGRNHNVVNACTLGQLLTQASTHCWPSC